MSKLSYLLVLFFFISSCSSIRTQNEVNKSQTTAAPSETHEAGNTAVAKEVASQSVTVDKENNAIKIEAPETHTDIKDPNTKKKIRPLFDWPVWEARMSRGFLPHGSKRSKRPHKGIDLAAPRGSAVMASQEGVVIYTGSAFKGYGKMIMIESTDPRDGGNWATLYGHLDKIVVYEGKKVTQGEVIGALGNTGRSSGPHLHFEIRRLNGPIDPLPMLPAGEALTNDVDNGAPEE